jgi:Astacin (Peptidase family M12A)
MRKMSAGLLLLTAAATVGLAAVVATDVAPPARAQEPIKHQADEKHGDMFRSTQKPKTITVGDPRLRVDRVRYTPEKQAVALEQGEPGNTLVLIEGDIVLGTEEELEKQALGALALQAKAINPDDPNLGLDATARETIRKLQALAPADERGAVAAKQVLVSQLLGQAVNLGQRATGDKEHLRGIAEATRQLSREIEEDRPRARAIPLPGAEEIDDTGLQRSVVVSEVGGFKWPDGVIPYQFHSSFPAGQRQSVLDAIAHWHSKTNRIKLIEKEKVQDTRRYQNWIVFVPAQGCAARVGRRPTPGAQAVQLASGCLTPQAIHEIGHIVGMWHEQSRNDRDRFLRVLSQNIDPGTLFNFDMVLQNGIDVGPFDFNSIMLYPPLSFTSNGQPSMQGLTAGTGDFGIFTPGVGGRTQGLSPGDIEGVEFLYPVPAPANP